MRFTWAREGGIFDHTIHSEGVVMRNSGSQSWESNGRRSAGEKLGREHASMLAQRTGSISFDSRFGNLLLEGDSVA